jgi:site-specific recombinase XerC
MYGCGLRIGEAAPLEIGAIDSANMVLRITGKGDKQRLAPLPRPLVSACLNPLLFADVTAQSEVGVTGTGVAIWFGGARRERGRRPRRQSASRIKTAARRPG